MTKNKIPEVFVLGLPNAGKSTLVNALTKRKTSIIGSTPNTTRDKVSTIIEFDNEKKLMISDLPGFLEKTDEFNVNFQENILRYIDNAEHIIFLIDVNSKDYSGLDSIFDLISKNNLQNKTTTVFNKTENIDISNIDKRMYKYIFNKEFFISAYHKVGLELLENYLKKFSKKMLNDLEKKSSIVIIGRPNAGKSTLFNSLLNNKRSSVSNVPGTTRDKIVENINLNQISYQISDTAGIPRKTQKNQIDKYSSSLSLRSLESASLALIIIDSEVGLTFEDKRILKESIENTVTPIVVLNKWDLLENNHKDEINKNIKNELKQYQWVNVLRISALNKKNIKQISKNIDDVEKQLNTRIGTSELNMNFRELWLKSPPHPFRGKRAKLKYVTQYSTYPPEFSFNLSSRIPKNYHVFIENNIRESYNMKNICFKVKINA
ncbi:MAG: ribosome biogenesis GTPase Der [Candidatus Actinomarina sp.]